MKSVALIFLSVQLGGTTVPRTDWFTITIYYSLLKFNESDLCHHDSALGDIFLNFVKTSSCADFFLLGPENFSFCKTKISSSMSAQERGIVNAIFEG
jgi:hypothetical protein